jgi:hypothetical protein
MAKKMKLQPCERNRLVVAFHGSLPNINPERAKVVNISMEEKRSGTGGITAFAEHDYTPSLLCASKGF